MVQLRVSLVILLVVLAGCAGQAGTSPGPAAPALDTTLLTAPQRVAAGRFAGRSLELYASRIDDEKTRWKNYHYQGKTIFDDVLDPSRFADDEHFELRVDGKTVLPLDYHQMCMIPGQGVFVLAADQRLKQRYYPGSKNGKAALYQRLIEHRDKPLAASEVGFWKQYDPATGQLMPTDIVVIERYHGPPKKEKEGYIERDVWPDPAYVLIRHRPDETVAGRTVGRLDVDVLSPAGVLQGSYAHGRIASWLSKALVFRDRFSVLTTYRPDATLQDHLLGADLQLVAAPDHRIVPVGQYLAKTAPGVAPADELFVILQNDGTFSAPPGVLGVRPVSSIWSPKWIQYCLDIGQTVPATQWLVRWAAPGEPGFVEGSAAPAARWSLADDLARIPSPAWKSATILPPVFDSNWAMSRYFWENTALLVEDNGRWTVFNTAGRKLGTQELKRDDVRFAADTPEQAVRQYNALATEEKGALDYAEKRAERLRQEQIAHRAALYQDEQWSRAWAAGNKPALVSLLPSRGPEDWWKYLDWAKDASPELFTQGAERMTDPARKKQLLALAGQRKIQVANEAIAAKRREAERVEQLRQQAAARNAPSSSGMSGSDWGSKLSGNWNYTPPAPSAANQRREYETKLNQQIYGTKWDPYR